MIRHRPGYFVRLRNRRRGVRQSVTLGGILNFVAENRFNFADPEACMIAQHFAAMMSPVFFSRRTASVELPSFDIPVYPIDQGRP